MINRRGLTVLLIWTTLVVPSCTRVSDGVPSAGTERSASPGSSEAPTTEATEATGTTETTSPEQDVPEPGVVPTTLPPAQAGTSCAPVDLPAVRSVAQVPDPEAPTVTVGVPEGWSTASGNGDTEGARLEGPDSIEAVIIIEPTDLEPAAAFRGWIDLTADATVSTVSTLPAELCGYSGQTMIGTLSDDRQNVEYRDRLVHVPTQSGNYLIVVHVEAPSGTPGFEEAAAVLTADFEIAIP